MQDHRQRAWLFFYSNSDSDTSHLMDLDMCAEMQKTTSALPPIIMEVETGSLQYWFPFI